MEDDAKWVRDPLGDLVVNDEWPFNTERHTDTGKYRNPAHHAFLDGKKPQIRPRRFHLKAWKEIERREADGTLPALLPKSSSLNHGR